jgi:hypothetical protein
MEPDKDTKARRRAVVHLVELAMRAEHEELDDEARTALDEVAKVLDAHRRAVEWRQMQNEITFLVERVLVPVYEHVQANPTMTEPEVEAHLVAVARRCGFEFSREVLDDLVLLEDEITGPGAVKAASEAVGAALGRAGRSILNWMAESEGFPPNMSTRSGTRAANALLHLAGLLQIEAAEQGREPLVKGLTAVMDFIQGKPVVAPPPVPDVKLFVPPEAKGEPK